MPVSIPFVVIIQDSSKILQNTGINFFETFSELKVKLYVKVQLNSLTYIFLTHNLKKSSQFHIIGVGQHIVVGPTPTPKNGGGVQQSCLRTPADGIPPSNQNPDTLVDWWLPSIQPAGAPTPREPSTNPCPVFVCLCWCS